MDAEIGTVVGVNSTNFKDHIATIAGNPKLASIVALASKARAVVHVLEGSHVSGSNGSSNGRGFTTPVPYTISPENLVIVDSRVAAELSVPTGKSIEILTASASVR
jgi:hypothetical protein